MRSFVLAVTLFSFSVLSAGCTAAPDTDSQTTGSEAPLTFPETGADTDQPQILPDGDGDLILVWTDRESDDVFLAGSEAGQFLSPVRVNSRPGSVNRIPIDEMRPSVAVGPGERIAVAWTDQEYDIQVAISEDGGRSFGDSVRLNQDEGDALQEFPSIAFGPDGVLHAVWLDPRMAPEEAEEPADLYYAKLEDGAVTEVNLTEAQESSVCGCCLPDLRVEPDQSLTITFRNTTDDGYRDPFRIRGSLGNGFGPPERISPPVWQIDFCPVAGPIAVNDMTLWLDGSQGPRRLLSSYSVDRDPDVLLEDSDERLLLLPPRRVTGLTDDFPVILVPGDTGSYLMTPIEHSWLALYDDLPWWVTSASMHDEDLVMVGVEDGILQHETRTLNLSN